jgi:hypothetical protein
LRAIKRSLIRLLVNAVLFIVSLLPVTPLLFVVYLYPVTSFEENIKPAEYTKSKTTCDKKKN